MPSHWMNIQIPTLSICATLLVGCVQAVPPDLIAAIEAIDRNLIELRAAEAAPDDYAHFVRQWILLKARVQSDDDLIRWPWESNDLEDELRRLQDEGGHTIDRLNDRQTARRQMAEAKLASVEERIHLIASQVDSIEGRIVLGEKPVQTDLLIKQARS